MYKINPLRRAAGPEGRRAAGTGQQRTIRRAAGPQGRKAAEPEGRRAAGPQADDKKEGFFPDILGIFFSFPPIRLHDEVTAEKNRYERERREAAEKHAKDMEDCEEKGG